MDSILKRSRRPDITFYESGKIDIRASIAKQLGLKKGDVIDIAKDRGEFYLYVLHKAEDVFGSHEAQIRPTSNVFRTNHFRTYSRRLTNAIYEATQSREKKVELFAGGMVEAEGIGNAVPLITRRPL